MTAAGLDGSTIGSNLDLNDPVGYAIRQLGGSVSDFTNVADGDLSAISTGDYDELLDVAELRLLENILGNFDDVNTTTGGISEALGQLGSRVEAAIATKREQIQKDYGRGRGKLKAGTIGLDFAQHGDD